MIILPAIFRDNGQMADGSRKATLYLQEAPEEQLLEIIKLSGTMGYFVFSPNPGIKQEDIPDIPIDTDIERSPSQQQRAIIYKIWENTDKTKPFPDYYKSQMFKINEHLKETYL